MNFEAFWAKAAVKIAASCRLVWQILIRMISKYLEIDGELRSASFAYYAFFALFPLLLLFISLGTMIWGDRAMVANQVLGFMHDYIPTNEQKLLESTVIGVLNLRTQAGLVAILALAWSSLRFFQALVHGINRAWGTKEYSWWRLPLANLGMMAILAVTLLLGVVAPVVMTAIEAYLRKSSSGAGYELMEYSLRMARRIFPSLILFFGLLMFYKYAPRRKTLVREVWVSAALVTVFLLLLQKAFVIYAANFAKFNALYGTLSGGVAVLMWIYLSGSLIIFGGCLCAAQSEIVSGEIEKLESP
jgi:Ca2+-transporting ATPase